MSRKDIFYSGSLCNIPEYRSDPKGYSRAAARDLLDRHHAPSPPPPSTRCSSEDLNLAETEVIVEEAKSGQVKVKRKWSKSHLFCFDFIKKRTSLDCSLLKDPVFLAFAASNFLTSIGFNAPYVYTVDRAVAEGMEESRAALLLSVIGIANTLGRIVLGYLSDRVWINRLYLYNLSLAVCGINMALSGTFGFSFGAQAFNCAVFGVTSGAYVGLTSVVLVDLLGLDRLTNAFGLLLLCQGIASVIGPPIIGSLKDSLGDYEGGYYFAGAMIFVSGVMLFVLPSMLRKRNQRSR